MPSTTQAEVDGAIRLFLVFIVGMTKTEHGIRGLDEDRPSYDPVPVGIHPQVIWRRTVATRHGRQPSHANGPVDRAVPTRVPDRPGLHAFENAFRCRVRSTLARITLPSVGSGCGHGAQPLPLIGRGGHRGARSARTRRKGKRSGLCCTSSITTVPVRPTRAVCGAFSRAKLRGSSRSKKCSVFSDRADVDLPHWQGPKSAVMGAWRSADPTASSSR